MSQAAQRDDDGESDAIVAEVMFHRPTSTSWQAREFVDRDRGDVRG
jgi:hypothetical protein